MHPFNPVMLQISRVLNDQQPHSIHTLSQRLQQSQATIMKVMNTLQMYGIPITITDQGYLLQQRCCLLDRAWLRQALHPLTVHVYESIDSTNNLPTPADNTALFLAERQTQGRGQRQRPWHTPFGVNLNYSLYHHIRLSPAHLTGLSAVVGLSIIEALQQLGLANDIRIKWPNDLYLQGKKLGGILIESQAHHTNGCAVMIGVGLNVNMTPPQPITQPWIALGQVQHQILDRNQLCVTLVQQQQRDIGVFSQHGLAAFRSKWKQHDLLYQRHVQLRQHHRIIEGIALGIDDTGQLLLQELDSGQIKHFSSGDTRLIQFNAP